MIIDFHSHILPGADHGSNSRKVTRVQLELMAKAGTERVVATPHFYPHMDTLSTFMECRDACVRRFLTLERPQGLTVHLGAEVAVCIGLESMEGLEQLAICGTNVILLEMPFGKWSDATTDVVLAIRDRGLCPVLAHIDRYDRREVEPLLAQGIAAQLNADGLVGFWDYRANRKYLNGVSVVALGSDLHGAEKKDYDLFLRMQKRLGNAAKAVFDRTERLLEGALPIESVLKEEIAHT